MSEGAAATLAEQPDVAQEAKDAIENPSLEVYHNPLEQSSRWTLATRAYAYRTGASIAFGMGNMASPAVPSPHKTIYFDSTLSEKHKGKEKIKADMWTPDRPLSRKSSRSSLRSLNKKRSKESGEESGDSLKPPPLSRFSSRNSMRGGSDDNGDKGGGSSLRPSLSRLSSRISFRSSHPQPVGSKSSLSLPTTPSGLVDNPMDQIPSTLNPQPDPTSRRPAVINFHGGGFVLGQGTDDGRWAMAVMQALGAVVFSVEYRLAPTYPFPTPVEDCADAILQIWRRADEFWIDPNRITLTGFSAGGTLALASWVLLQDHAKLGYKLEPALTASMPRLTLSTGDEGGEGGSKMPRTAEAETPQPVGLMLFYPLLDWTMSRPRKRLTCSKPEMTLPRSLTDMFDAAYIYPPDELKANLDNPLLSPGLMPDYLVDKLPPVQLCLCEYDMLLAEGKIFAERLRARGKEVGYRVVPEAKHAWDKPLPFSPPDNLGVEYGEAVRAMAKWLGAEDVDSGNGNLTDESVPEGVQV
ncbi:lipase 2 [Diaporthe helianthi]|uniref:Lipase 2 n=1 Tax=Diaporthe helianthi TaxID=158607 RepID=A0A2P5IC86_DIAHE|nr:lipase 2 [Diaporthe helianthi]